MSFHKNEETGSIHIMHNYEYADAAARTGASGFTAGDIGKVALQLDDDSIWVLIATAPTWSELTSSTVASHASTHQNGGADEINVAGLSGSLADAQTPTSHASTHQSGGSDSIKLDDLASPDDNTDLNATTGAHGLCPKLGGGTINFFRADGSWAAPSGGSSFPEFQFFADQFQLPLSSDWAVNANAAIVADSNNVGLTVARFDDSTEEGVGFVLQIPTGATNIKFTFASRAETAPGSTSTVCLTLYERECPDNAAVSAWSSEYDLTDLSIPTNEYWQIDTQTISLSALGLTAGRIHQFQLDRDTPDASDDLSGDWTLYYIKVEFT